MAPPKLHHHPSSHVLNPPWPARPPPPSHLTVGRGTAVGIIETKIVLLRDNLLSVKPPGFLKIFCFQTI